MTTLRVIGIDILTDAQIDRFLSMTEPSGDCVVWRGEIDKDGYGKFAARYGKSGKRRKRWMAHRVVHELMIGPIPDRYQVDHLCGVRACVLPDHLEAVTPRENHDRWSTAITHCPQGHEYTLENTYIKASGARRCRTCARDYARRRRIENPRHVNQIARVSRARKQAKVS